MNKKYRTVYNKASKTWTLSLVNEEKQVSSRMNGKRFVFNCIRFDDCKWAGFCCQWGSNDR